MINSICFSTFSVGMFVVVIQVNPSFPGVVSVIVCHYCDVGKHDFLPYTSRDPPTRPCQYKRKIPKKKHILIEPFLLYVDNFTHTCGLVSTRNGLKQQHHRNNIQEKLFYHHSTTGI